MKTFIPVVDTSYKTTRTIQLFNNSSELKDSPVWKVYIAWRGQFGPPSHAYIVPAETKEIAIQLARKEENDRHGLMIIHSVKSLSPAQIEAEIEVYEEEMRQYEIERDRELDYNGDY